MNRPKASTLIVGYPLVTVPLFLLDGWFGYTATANTGFGWGTLLALLFGAWLVKCSEEAGRYRAWRRDWNALDPNYRPPQPLRLAIRVMMALPILLGFFWLLANFNDPSSPARLIAWGIGVAIPMLWIARLILRRRKRRPTSQDWIVTQAIPRSLPAPSVAEAYARLPDYCRPLLTSQARNNHEA